MLSLGGTRFPVPDLAVGRLVETASEASGMIDAYLNPDGSVKTVTPATSLVTGYDFIADSAQAVKSQLELGTGAGPRTRLIGAGWTADELRAYLLGTKHYDTVYLAGHFDANALLAADFATTRQRQPSSRRHRSTS